MTLRILLLPAIALSLWLIGCGQKPPAPTATAVPATNQTPAASATTAAQPLQGQVNPFLTQQLRAFVQQTGRLPADFGELARTRLDSRPRPPAGTQWVIDPATQEVKAVKQ
jgi:hypothetical protein